MSADRNCHWLMGGGAVSMLGDQVTLIALPWLVLKLTGDPLALSLVLAAMSLPRAVFILVGSAMLPQTVPPALLQPANGVLIDMRQMGVLIGTVLAGHGAGLRAGMAMAGGRPSG